MTWCHPILFELLLEVFWGKKTSEGILHPELFDGVISAELIALIFTVVSALRRCPCFDGMAR